MNDSTAPTPDVPVDACRRWHHGAGSWRHPDEQPDVQLAHTTFNPVDYQIRDIPEVDAKHFVLTHHYAASWPAVSHRFGLIHTPTDQLVGVAAYGIPVQAKVLTAAYPTLTPYTQSIELSRLVLLDAVPANAESWFIARCHRALKERGVRGVVSFADPQPRYDRSGALIKPGHFGIVYQALNAHYAGRGTARTLTMLPDGTVLNDRSRSKILNTERGAQHVIAKLTSLGAPEWTPNQDPRNWLNEALAAIGAQKIKHPGNHRYLFPLAKKLELGMHVTSNYPKPGN